MSRPAQDTAGSSEAATVIEPGAAPAPTGADLDPAATPSRPGFRERARVRRRARYLRRAREVALRDLGGFVFDLHRFGRERDDLVRAKVDVLAKLDAELRALEAAIGEPADGIEELRLAGVGGTCPDCHELFGSEARFCSSCGRSLRG